MQAKPFRFYRKIPPEDKPGVPQDRVADMREMETYLVLAPGNRQYLYDSILPFLLEHLIFSLRFPPVDRQADLPFRPRDPPLYNSEILLVDAVLLELLHHLLLHRLALRVDHQP